MKEIHLLFAVAGRNLRGIEFQLGQDGGGGNYSGR